jgi:hypothetical protein
MHPFKNNQIEITGIYSFTLSALKIKKLRSVRSLQTQDSNLFSHFEYSKNTREGHKFPVKETREKPSYLSNLLTLVTEDTSPLFKNLIIKLRI